MSKRPEFDSPASGLLFPEVLDILKSDPSELNELTEELHPADLADMVGRLEEDEVLVFFSALPVDRAADVAEYVEDSLRASLVTSLDPDRAARIVAAMNPDDRADVMADLDPEPAAAILSRIALPMRRETQELLAYEPNTAGGLMTTAFVALPQATRADHALALVRTQAQEKETIYSIYVIDQSSRVVGVVSLRELLAAETTRRLNEIMEDNVVACRPDMDQEEVARLISRYDLLALPVLDDEDHLLGIVTVDDVIDVLVAEATEDVQKMSAIATIEEPYFVAGFWEMMRKRVGWLVLLFLGEMLTSTALRHFDQEFQKVASLVLFIPLIISAGGNAGSQSSTLITRSLATGEVKVGQFLAVFFREGFMGLALGIVLGLVGAIRALVFHMPMGICGVVGLAVVGVVLNGCVVGSLAPLILKRAKLDPALMSAPFVASLCDVTGIVIYFTLAKLILSI